MPDGTVLLEDGREMVAVVSDTGSLGVRAKQVTDHLAALDQYISPGLGLEPVMAAKNHFDTSGLDQAS